MLFKKKKNKNEAPTCSPYWNEQIFPKFESIFKETNAQWVSHECLNIANDAKVNYQSALNDWKNHNNKHLISFFKFLWVFSIFPCLGIPLYWVNKKYKNLKKEKSYWDNVLEEAKKKKLDIHNQIISKLNINEIFNKFSGIIKYQHQGAIPSVLVEEMQSNSFFDLKAYSKHYNPYISSWGIFDNKIVINASKQFHDEYMETYTGSIQVPYTYHDSEGKSMTGYETVVATYSHPAHNIYNNQRTFSFMQSCSNLEFYFSGESNAHETKKFDNKNHYAALENKEFNKKFNWTRNDDAQFRMVFTPYAQETFLKEVGKTKEINNALRWSKHATFIQNDYATSDFSFLWDKSLYGIFFEYINNVEENTDDLIARLYQSILNYYFHIFQSLNYMFLTTIMSSEDHSSIIHNVENHKHIEENNQLFFAHNVLNDLLGVNIIVKDTDCFHTLKNTELLEELVDTNEGLYFSQFEGLTFTKNNCVKYVTAMSRSGIVQVPVNYIDFVPATAEGFVAYTFIPKCENFFYNLNGYSSKTNINNEEITNIVNSLNKKYLSISLRNNVLAVYVKPDQYNEFRECDKAQMVKLVKLLSPNGNINSNIDSNVN